jgi:hypothetical protein
VRAGHCLLHRALQRIAEQRVVIGDQNFRHAAIPGAGLCIGGDSVVSHRPVVWMARAIRII